VFDRYSAHEKRRLLLGAVLFAVGSLALGVTSFSSSGTVALAIYFGGAVVFLGVAALLADELRTG